MTGLSTLDSAERLLIRFGSDSFTSIRWLGAMGLVFAAAYMGRTAEKATADKLKVILNNHGTLAAARYRQAGLEPFRTGPDSPEVAAVALGQLFAHGLRLLRDLRERLAGSGGGLV